MILKYLKHWGELNEDHINFYSFKDIQISDDSNYIVALVVNHTIDNRDKQLSNFI